MAEENILEQLGRKGANVHAIAAGLVRNRKRVSELAEAIQIEKSSRKYAYEKALRVLSEKKPELVYPYFNVFEKMLDSENNFLKWGSILTIANLAGVDTENKFEKIFKKYYKPLKGPAMVTAANIIGSSAIIARARPDLAEAIAKEILKVEKAEFYHKGTLSPECRNVALGQAIDTFDRIYDLIGARTRIRNFVKRQLKNTRIQVVKKAERFMKNNQGI